MPKRTLYVREADEELWQRAEELAGGEESLSGIVAQALREYVAKQEAQNARGGDFEKVELEVNKGGSQRKIRFVGRLIAQGESEGIYAGRSGRVLVYFTRGADLWHEVYDSLSELVERDEEHLERYGVHLIDPDLLAEAAEELGVDYTEEIDL